VKLSFGIKATANLFNLDVSRLNPVDNDPSLQNFNNKFSLILGLEFIYIQTRRMGLSIPNFIESNRYNDNEVAIFKEK
jgi:hypothetical protein